MAGTGGVEKPTQQEEIHSEAIKKLECLLERVTRNEGDLFSPGQLAQLCRIVRGEVGLAMIRAHRLPPAIQRIPL